MRMFFHNSHSFNYYGYLYSASLRLLLRSAPDHCTAKKNSFQARVECISMNSGEQSLRQWKSIPDGRANHRECKSLPWAKGTKRTPVPLADDLSIILFS